MGHGVVRRGLAFGTPHKHQTTRAARALPAFIVSRWPVEMGAVYTAFQALMRQLQPNVVDREYARQLTLEHCWGRI